MRLLEGRNCANSQGVVEYAQLAFAVIRVQSENHVRDLNSVLELRCENMGERVEIDSKIIINAKFGFSAKS